MGRFMETKDFKFKGTYLITTKKFLEKEFGNEFANNIVSKYYPQTAILASSWYITSPVIQMLYECASEKKLVFRDFMLKITAYTLESDLNGVYKFFMKLGGIKRIIEAMPQLGNSYTDWINLKVVQNSDNFVKLEVIIPMQFEEYFLHGHEGSMLGIFNVYGKKLNEYNETEKQVIQKDGKEFSKLIIEIRYE